MGKILTNQWEILTNLEGLTFNYQGQVFTLKGLAKVTYRNDEIDMYRDVEIPDPDEYPTDTLKIWMNNVLLKDDGAGETHLFNALHDYITEIIEDTISLQQTDITNEDLQIGDGQLDEVDEALEMLGMEMS